jgi:hypothetical protein
MRSPSIEWLHGKLSRQIKLAQSYTEIPELAFIIEACRLKPYDYIFDERNNKITLYKWWFDEFGNSLSVIKNKKIDIVFNDLRLDKKNIVCTDLYYGLSIDKIIKMSKLVHLVTGKDEDLYEDCALLTLLGIDNHLRTYLYLYGEWQQISPLLIGMKNLKLIADHTDIKYYLSVDNKENSALPCISQRAWLSCLPASASFVSEVGKQSETLASLLKQ